MSKMKLIKIAFASAAIVSASLAQPAYARKSDGERGYEVGCSIGWLLGLRICQELPWYPFD